MGRQRHRPHIGSPRPFMIIYLTYNDAPSGIYSSQVIDVVKFLSKEMKAPVKLVAFISLRGFLQNRTKIKRELQGAIVLPMFPGIKRWRKNVLFLKLLCMIKRPNTIIGRSLLATQLAFGSGVKKIIYDGRGAISAEWEEYKVVEDATMISTIAKLEKEAIINSDYRIAVSQQLLLNWQHTFGYNSDRHVVIPCTLSRVFDELNFSESLIASARKELGLAQTDIVFLYSGSVAGWQSFNLLCAFIKPVLGKSKSNKMVFLSEMDENINKLAGEFKGQVICKKLAPAQVAHYLVAGDYGLLIREHSVTNQVASPVKFAEYLACGLKVIISDSLGDYSRFVLDHNCGYIYNVAPIVEKPLYEDKVRLRLLSKTHFTKAVFKEQYLKVVGSN